MAQFVGRRVARPVAKQWQDAATEWAVVSPILWSRAIGWYFAGLMDVLEYLPANHADRAQLVSIANSLARGLATQQDTSRVLRLNKYHWHIGTFTYAATFRRR